MRKCAICHRTDVRYTKEHVIPEALGGRYVRNQMVCANCNSELGRRVDDALVNHDGQWFFTAGELPDRRFFVDVAARSVLPGDVAMSTAAACLGR